MRIMRRILPAVLLLAAVLCLAGTAAADSRGQLSDTVSWWLYEDEFGGELYIQGTGAMPDYDAGHPSPLADMEGFWIVFFDEGITHVGARAFSGNTSIEYFITSPGVADIGESACENCPSLTSAQFEIDLAHIGANAFSGCPGMSYVDFAGSSAQWAEVELDSGNDCIRDLVQCRGEPVGSGTCGSLSWVVTAGGKLTISGEGPIPDY